MSTAFDVLSGEIQIPSIDKVVSGTETLLNNFLRDLGVSSRCEAQFEIIEDHRFEKPVRQSLFDQIVCRNKNEHSKIKRYRPQAHQPFWWPENHYGWFTIKGVAGGTDCYTQEVSEPWAETTWFDAASSKPGMQLPIREHFEKSKRQWSFRRSASQPCIINLAYGLLAAQVASLTNGIIYSDDGAWDIEQLPANSDSFLEFYFKPNSPRNKNDCYSLEWASRCLDQIKIELSNRPK